MVLFEQVVVDAGVVVEAVDVGLGDEAHEVVVAREVLGEQDQVVALLGLVARGVVAGGRDVRLASEDGLDGRQVAVALRGAALVVERLEREEVAVVGDGERGHFPFARPPHERGDAALAVKQGVRGVDMKMDEIGHGLRCHYSTFTPHYRQGHDEVATGQRRQGDGAPQPAWAACPRDGNAGRSA